MTSTWRCRYKEAEGGRFVMRRCTDVVTRGRQRGWAGLVMVLVALAIVAFLAKDALKK